jgi:hypothetical protein
MSDDDVLPEPVVTTDTGSGRGRSAVRVFAIVGLVLSLVLAVGILFGRAWLADQVAGVFDSVDTAIGRGNTVVAMTTGRLQERVADLDALVADLSTVAASSAVPPAIVERATSIADRFGEIRDGWVQVRARIDAALETLAQIDRALPFIDLPEGPTQELAALDQRLAEINTNVAGLRTGATARVQAVVDGATGLRGAVDRVADAGTRIEEGLSAVEDRVDRAQANVDLVMWITTVVLLLLVGYVALLNWLLLRGYRR